MGAATATATTIPVWTAFRDAVALTKPRLSSLVMATTGLGVWLAPGEVGAGRVLLTLFGTAMAVGSANTFNMYFDRDIDAVMRRTRERPLPAGRLEPWYALVQGLVLAVGSVVALGLWVDVLAGALAALALASYALVYTPLKRRTPLALLVGTVPGALPPLVGWTAVTGTIDLGGLVLFAIVAVWQIPHFLAIALYLKDDFARADLKVLPLVHGDAATRRCIVAGTLALAPVSVALVPLGIGSMAYGAVALVLAAALLVLALRRPEAERGITWARRFFFGTLIYLTVLIAALLVL